jgi:uncharacterized SAM-binding protein YcdF (DUF218 family)
MDNFLLFLLAVTLAGAVIFGVVYGKDPTRIFGGFMLDCTIGAALCTLLGALSTARHLSLFFGILLIVLLVLFVGLALGGIWLVIAYLLFNAVQVFKHERHTLQNMLSLLLGVGLLAQMVVVFVSAKLLESLVFVVLFGVLWITEAWLAVTAVSFLTSSLLCRLDRPRLHTDYIIVLGSGLIRGGEVSPLLAGRIEAAIRFYRRAAAKGLHPKLVLSGGQGADETRPEGEAMREYALAHGVAAGDALAETQSKNTLENFRFSKAVMDADAAGQSYTCGFATSDYHVLRACRLARQAGLTKAKGLGARTARYYVTNATIREYIAVMLSSKRVNITVLGFLTGGYCLLLAFLSFFEQIAA